MAPTDDEFREMAKARVGFRMHAMAYVAVNLLLIAIWWIGGDSVRLEMGEMSMTETERGSFWPIWSILGWGIGLAFHGWSVFGSGKDAVAREEERLREKYGRS